MQQVDSTNCSQFFFNFSWNNLLENQIQKRTGPKADLTPDIVQNG